MSNVVSIKDFLAKKLKDTEDKPKIYVNHTTGKITGPNGPKQEPMQDRLTRIRRSLERINSLMAELKEASRDRTQS